MEQPRVSCSIHQGRDTQICKISCVTKYFSEFLFSGPHAKPHGVQGLINNYYICLDPKLGHGKFAIWQIPYVCVACTNLLDKPWATGMSQVQHPQYQPVIEYTWWPVSGYFNNWIIIQSTNKIHQVRKLMIFIRFY